MYNKEINYRVICGKLTFNYAIAFVKNSNGNFGMRRSKWEKNEFIPRNSIKFNRFNSEDILDALDWEIIEYEEVILPKEKNDKENIFNSYSKVADYISDNKTNIEKHHDCQGSLECKKRCLHECHHHVKDNNKNNCGCKSHGAIPDISLDDIKEAFAFWENNLRDKIILLFLE